MPRIHQLPPHEAQKIAAGEVVERPANALKELLENALDAGATQISVYIEDAGKQLIRIVDNGCGMSPEDAQLCYKLHTTSKVTSIDDLEKIQTFGFRGEALASISAVSKVTLITKEQEAQQGIKHALEQGNITKETTVPCTTGTDIQVHDLFYNIPARKKFLKKRETEWRHIIQLFQAFCLDYHVIHFKLFSEGKQVHNCPPAQNLTDRLTQLWGHSSAQHMIPVEKQHKQQSVTVTGAVSNHHYVRYDRNHLFFFVNKRWVKNHTLARALLKGYLNVLPPARYPAACIHIEIDPALVDINIHPRKEEVQFLHPRIVETLIQQAVREAKPGREISAQLVDKG